MQVTEAVAKIARDWSYIHTYYVLDVLLFAFSIHNLLHCGSTKKDAEYSLCYIFVHTAQSSDCLRQIFLRHEREN